MKHKILKSIFALILVCSIFSLNFLSVGAAYQEYLQANGIEVTKTKYVTIVEQNNIINRTMSESSLKSLKNALSKQTLTKHEQNIEIMRTLGFEEKTIEGMTAESIDSLFEDAVSLETQTIYMKANADGTTSIVSEEECLTAVEARNTAASTAAATTSDNDGWGNWTSEDGYLRMTISCAYIDPASMNGQKGWYYFHTWYEWLIVPNYRLTDGMALAVPGCSWDTLGAYDAYYSSMYYNAVDVNGNSASFDATPKTTQDLTVTPGTGVYYEWKMPEDGSNEITYIQFYAHARGQMMLPDQTMAVTAYISYVHTYAWFSLNPTLNANFGWTTEGIAAGIYLNLELTQGLASNEYHYNLHFQYSPN